MKDTKIFYLRDAEEKKKIRIKATHLSGDEWQALCPKHDDHNPSLSINRKKKVFHCHGCSFSGGLCNKNIKVKSDVTQAPLLTVDPMSRRLGQRLEENGKWTPKAFKHFGVGQGSYYGESCLIIPVGDFQRVYLYN